MTAKTIKIPDLPAGFGTSLSVKLVHPTTLAVLETVSLAESGEGYNGTVTGAHAGQLLFKILAGTSLIGTRLRTIEDIAATFIIMTELEERASDGRGEYIVTITVTDGTDPIEDVLVRVSGNGIQANKYTNASGVAKFALNDGDYDVLLIATGFDTSVESLTVSGATADSYAMTAISITPPASALLATGVGIAYNELGVVEVGVPFTIQLVRGPGVDGYAFDTKPRTVNSIAGGVIEFTGLIRGATYTFTRGDTAASPVPSIFGTRSAGASATFVVPNLASFNLPEVSGLDAEA